MERESSLAQPGENQLDAVEDAKCRVESIRGWLTASEASFLYALARDWPGEGQIVELGSYQGRSTVCLALGLMARLGDANSVLSIDTHRGSSEHQPGGAYFDPATVNPDTGEVDTYPVLMANLRRCGVAHRVECWRCTTQAAALQFTGSVRLLFVDADHEEHAVRNDVDSWLPHLDPGGLLVMHDFDDWPGPTVVAHELLNAGYRRVGQQGTALALTRGIE